MRTCQWDPNHPIAEDADPRRIFCSGRCKQAAYRGRLLLQLDLVSRFEVYARTSPEAARILAALKAGE